MMAHDHIHDPFSMEHLHPYFADEHPVMLDEMTYKDLLADITNNNIPGAVLHNLPVRDWAPLIKFVKYQGFDKGIMKFFIPNHYNGWFNYIQFVEWEEQVADLSTNAMDTARLLMWSGNIRVHCPCASYLYHGYAYILTQLDAAIVPEERFPTIRNPELKGVCCKHLRKCLKTLGFHAGDLAAEVKKARAKLL